MKIENEAEPSRESLYKEAKAEADQSALEELIELRERRKILDTKTWMDKRIRPFTLFYLLIMFGLASFLDAGSDWFNMPQVYVTIYGSLLGLTIAFYFTIRTVEKLNKVEEPQWD